MNINITKNQRLISNKYDIKGKNKIVLDGRFVGIVRGILYSSIKKMDLVSVSIVLHKDVGFHKKDQEDANSFNSIHRYSKKITVEKPLDPLEEGQDYLISVTKSDEEYVKSEGVLIGSVDEPSPMEMSKFIVPINYQRTVVGKLIASVSATKSDALLVQLSNVAGEVAQAIKRCQAREWIVNYHDVNYYWVGKSTALCQLHRVIDNMAHSTLPVLISGQSGTGKLVAAYTIHSYSRNPEAPFITAICDSWQADNCRDCLQNLYAEAQGGSLFLRGVDRLSYETFFHIQQFWYTHDHVRLIVGVTAKESDVLAKTSEIIDWLVFNSLNLHLPSLSERNTDIRDLVEFYAKQLGENRKVDFTEEAFQLMENYSWPGNVKQLQRLLEKLMVIVDDTSNISTGEIIKYFPQIKQDRLPLEPILKPLKEKIVQDIENEFSAKEAGVDHIATVPSVLPNSPIDHLEMLHDFDAEIEHPALVKALIYMAKNYQKSFSISDLASIAYVSASHLSYLFKQRFNLSFKQILTQIRIDKAQHLLKTMPARQVTQICNDVGFFDLSHFEKTFKKYVGMTPRKYKKLHSKLLSTTK